MEQFLRATRHQKQRKRSRDNERGNILFYILIAVALLASLSYAVSQSSRGSSDNLNEERSGLAASEILEYANVVSNAAVQLKLRGCAETELSFANADSATSYANPASPSGNICDVFHIAGGGVQYKAPQAAWLDRSVANTADQYGQTLFTAKTCINGIGTGISNCASDGAPAGELILAIPYLRREICIELNNKLNLGARDAAPPQDDGAAWGTDPAFIGTYVGATALHDTAGLLTGRGAGCFQSDTYPASGYHFYKVLLAR